MKNENVRRVIVLAITTAIIMSVSACGLGQKNNSKNETEATEVPTAKREITFENQAIGIDSVVNARQLGGYIAADGRKVKDNVLIRTGKLDNISDEDAQKLKEQYNLKSVIDFRMDSERKSEPDKDIAGVENIWISVMELDMSNPEIKETMKKMASIKDDKIQVLIEYSTIGDLGELYKKILTSESGQKGFAQFFDILLENDGGAVLWHCTHGKDRTGLAAALLLSALGVDEDTIVKDFELSNVPYTEQREYLYNEALKRGCDEQRAYMVSLLTTGVDGEHLTKAFDVVKTQYGSIHDYLNNQLGVSDEDIQILRDKYLEK